MVLRLRDCLFFATLSLCAATHALAENRFDLLVTAFGDTSFITHSAPGARNYAEEIVRSSRTFTETFKSEGDSFKAYLSPEQNFTCLLQGSCFSDHVGYLERKQREEFLPKSFAVREEDATYLQKIIESNRIEIEIPDFISQFKREISLAKKTSSRGNINAKKDVLVLRSGHRSELLQEQTINFLLEQYPDDFRFSYLNKTDQPAMFDSIGERWHSAAVFDDQAVKDFYTVDQWLEVFFKKLTEDKEKFLETKIFDAHQHVTSQGHTRFKKIMNENNISVVVAAALPRGTNYSGLPAENEAILNLGKDAPEMVLSFVMLSPNDPGNFEKFKDYRKRGARGLKLINGHGEYFSQNHQQQIDTPELREVFKYCERENIPVLWHVNTHLYHVGFLNALRDFPKVKFVNPHLAGYLSNAPQVVRELLQTYPNLNIDVSFGVRPDYLRRSIEDLSLRHEEWRKVFIEFSDRFLFGVDMVVTESTSRAHARMLYRLYRSMLERSKFDFHFFPDRGYSYFYEVSHYHDGLNGLNLPPQVLRKIYWDNAVRLYGLPQSAGTGTAVESRQK